MNTFHGNKHDLYKTTSHEQDLLITAGFVPSHLCFHTIV